MKFDTIKLSELAAIQTGPFGSQLHKEDYVVHGTPIVTVEHLGSRKFTEQNLPCVSDKDKERLKKYVLKTGDIVFSRVDQLIVAHMLVQNMKDGCFRGDALEYDLVKN